MIGYNTEVTGKVKTAAIRIVVLGLLRGNCEPTGESGHTC